MTKTIQDCIWGEIIISEKALQIIDSPEFQRLHYIKQLSFLYKVFPSATTSRFEHSIGVYHATKIMLTKLLQNSHLTMSENKQELIAISGLLHDIGHGPYSHMFDTFLKETDACTKKTDACTKETDEDKQINSISIYHEQRSCDIFKYMVEKYSFNFSEEDILFIEECILYPKKDLWYTQLVYNPFSSFDADKLDYLQRDSLKLGLVNTFDTNVIMNNMKIIKGRLFLSKKIKFEVEKLFLQREYFHKHIYRHKAVLSFQEYFLDKLKSKEKFLEISSLEKFLQLKDFDLYNQLTEKEQIEFETRTILKDKRLNNNSQKQVHSSVDVSVNSQEESESYSDNQRNIATKYLEYY